MGEKNVIVMYTCKDNLTPLLYSGKIKKFKKKKKGSGVAVSCGVGHRCDSDLVLLWLWCRPVATAPIGSLTWEPPYAAGVALKRKKKFLNKNK